MCAAQQGCPLHDMCIMPLQISDLEDQQHAYPAEASILQPVLDTILPS